MYLLVFVSELINLSEIRAHASPYYDDINVICAIIGALAILVGFLLGIIRYLPKRIHESKISKDTKNTKIPVDNKKYSTNSEEIKKEAANQNTPRHYNPSTLPEYSEWLNQSVTENRSDELRKALKYLEKHKILLISGVGGVGKSTLARALVDRRPANIPEPFWFDFSSNQGVKLGDILEKLAFYLKAPEISSFKEERRESGKYDVDKLTDELKKRDQIWLFFEDLSAVLEDRKFSDKEIELLFYGLRYNAHNAKIIITSRVVPVFENGEDLLNKTEEEIFYLSGLGKKFAIEYLFSNGLDKVEHEKLEELAKSVDGHPLALKLLVEVVKEHGVTVALNDLSRFQDKKEDIILKARKLFDKLAGEEKEFLEYISVYREPVGIEGIEVMLRENVLKTAVDKLINKSLLETDHNGSYWLHSLVQEFSYDYLKNKKEAHMIAYNYYKNMDVPKSPTKKEDLQPAIEAHYHACEAGEYDLAADVIRAWDLSNFLDLWGYPKTLIDIYEKLLPKDHFKGEPILKRKQVHRFVLSNLGIAYHRLGDAKKAIEYYEQALKIVKEIGDRRREGQNLGNLGLAYSALGDTKKAIEYYEQALKIYLEIDDRWGKEKCLGNLGNAYRALGDAKKAIKYHEQALKINLEIGNRQGEGTDLGNLGNAYSALGDAKKAIEYYEQALKIYLEISDIRGEGDCLGNLGVAYKDLGNAKKAIEYYEQALKIYLKIGDRRREGVDLGNLGVAYKDLGNAKKAIEYYEQALKIHLEIDDRRREGVDLGNLGLAYSALGDAKKAIEYYEQALKINPKNESVWYNKACAHSSMNKKSEALVDLKRAVEFNPRYRESAKNDKNFEKLWEDQDFKDIITIN